MIYDKMLKFGDVTDLGSTSTSAGVNAADWIDLGAHYKYDGTHNFGTQYPNIGEDGLLELNVKVENEDFAASTSSSGTIAIKVFHTNTAPSAITSLNSSSSNLLMTVATITGILTTSTTNVDGTSLVRMRLPAGTINRYVGLRFVATGQKLKDGKVTSWIGFPSETPK